MSKPKDKPLYPAGQKQANKKGLTFLESFSSFNQFTSIANGKDVPLYPAGSKAKSPGCSTCGSASIAPVASGVPLTAKQEKALKAYKEAIAPQLEEANPVDYKTKEGVKFIPDWMRGLMIGNVKVSDMHLKPREKWDKKGNPSKEEIITALTERGVTGYDPGASREFYMEKLMEVITVEPNQA